VRAHGLRIAPILPEAAMHRHPENVMQVGRRHRHPSACQMYQLDASSAL